jgi:hypothetical protein
MDCPLTDLMDQDARYLELVALLHPDGLACPGCQAADRPSGSGRSQRLGRRGVLDRGHPAAVGAGIRPRPVVRAPPD